MGDTHDTGTPQAEPHGWLGTETLRTHAGDFVFKNGYPAGDTAKRLRDLQTVNRATEVYLTQLMPVSEIALREGLRAFGVTKPTQVVIWESLMDAKTILLTANTETVYAISHLALGSDGPTVVEAPPHMLGFLQDGLQRYVADIGPLGPDKGQGGKFLVLPPGFTGSVPDGYFVLALTDLLGDLRRARLPGRGQDRPGRRADEADQDLSAGQGVVAATDGVHERLPQRDRHICSRTASASSNCWRCWSTKSRWTVSAPWNVHDAGHRHREGQAVRARRVDEESSCPRPRVSAARWREPTPTPRRRPASTTTPIANGRALPAA